MKHIQSRKHREKNFRITSFENTLLPAEKFAVPKQMSKLAEEKDNAMDQHKTKDTP